MASEGRFGRLLTAMVTPFDGDGGLDLKVAAELARHLVDNGNDGLVVSGSTGESPTLSDGEKREVLRAIVEAVGGRATIVAGTSTYDTAHSVELSKRAAEDGADALLAVTPYYNKPTQAGLKAHFTAIAEATDLPVMLYNIPGRTVTKIELDTLIELSAHPRIVAVKDACADLTLTARTVAETPADFQVYCGDDALTLPMLSVGAVGVVSVAGHVCGNQIAEMIVCFGKGDTEGALRIHQELLPIFRMLFVEPNPAPVKAAVEMTGFAVGPPRLPLLAASEETRAALAEELNRLVAGVGGQAGGAA